MKFYTLIEDAYGWKKITNMLSRIPSQEGDRRYDDELVTYILKEKDCRK